MFGLGFGELILIFLIALIFIGPKKLPELAKGLGKGIREFQNAAKGFSDQMQNDHQDSTHKAPTHTETVTAQLQEKTDAPAPTEEVPVEKKETHHS
jgi:sec-independent protein translocase protein TatA